MYLGEKGLVYNTDEMKKPKKKDLRALRDERTTGGKKRKIGTESQL